MGSEMCIRDSKIRALLDGPITTEIFTVGFVTSAKDQRYETAHALYFAAQQAKLIVPYSAYKTPSRPYFVKFLVP